MAAWISKHFIQLSKTLKWLSGIGLLLAVLHTGLLLLIIQNVENSIAYAAAFLPMAVTLFLLVLIFSLSLAGVKVAPLLLAALQSLPIASFLTNKNAGSYRIDAGVFFQQNWPAILLPSVILIGLLIYVAQKPKNPILVWGLVAGPLLLAVYNALHALFSLSTYILDRGLNGLFRLVPLLNIILGLLLAVVFGLLIMTGVFDSRTRRQLLNRQPEQSAG